MDPAAREPRYPTFQQWPAAGKRDSSNELAGRFLGARPGARWARLVSQNVEPGRSATTAESYVPVMTDAPKLQNYDDDSYLELSEHGLQPTATRTPFASVFVT